MAKPKYSIRGSVVSTTRLDRGFLCISQLCCLHIPSAERYTWSRVLKIFNNVFDVHITIDLKRQEKTGLTSTCCQIKI